MLSVRSDLLSDAFINEFKHLQDNVKSDPFPQVQALLEAEWEQPLTAIFTTLQEKPLASASIGQAHRGTLKRWQRSCCQSTASRHYFRYPSRSRFV